ncbi:MAG TPA: endonuclease NucS [Acidimicrobiia bacterium]|nr:endonuclease NucS [Acidimicrobiia bacterium]
MRLLVANCTVEYRGRLGARLAPARRLIVMKADGSLAIHSDSRAYKPLNWMSPPCRIETTETGFTATNPKGEELRIELHEVLSDVTVELGTDPGLEKDGVEAELQELIAARVEALKHTYQLVRREYPTDIGPVDLLCTDGLAVDLVDAYVAVEIKRHANIDAVEQVCRYLEFLGPRLDRPVRGMLVGQTIAKQARTLAESRGVECVEVDLDELRGLPSSTLRLF